MYGVVSASEGDRVMFVFSWFKTKKVDFELAIGTVSFDMPFERILAFIAMEDCGLKSPWISLIAGVSAKLSQMNNMRFSLEPSNSSIVSKTNSTD